MSLREFYEKYCTQDKLPRDPNPAMDTRQLTFTDYAVPDPIRIQKVEHFLGAWFKNSLSGLRLLELGIAEGGLADRLKVYGATCFGVDIHPRRLEGIRTVEHDLNYGLPKYDAKFDVIFAGEIVEHIIDDVRFVRDCANQLKSDGLLILTTPNLAFLVNRIRIMFGKMPLFSYAPYHYHIYTVEVVRGLLEENGFEIIKVMGSHILFSTRRHRIGRIFEMLADLWPTLGAHIIACARKR